MDTKSKISISQNVKQGQGPVYFLGIGGIGMSALARYFISRHRKVSGYDRAATPFSKKLEDEGMYIHYHDDVNLLDPQAELVVYTPAIPADHKELNFYKNNDYLLLKRSDVLEAVTSGCYTIAVAGTHGKTTTSTLIAHILRHSGYGCNAFLGGISANYDTNFWKSDNHTCVVEADEYDRSFLKLFPDVAIITAMDADHLDIYGTEKNMQDAFISFTENIKDKGLLIYKNNLHRDTELLASNKWSYAATDAQADCYARNITVQNGAYLFDAVINDRTIQQLTLHMGGRHNVENAVAAVAVALHVGIHEEKIRAALTEFKGVKRRFEYIVKPSAGNTGIVMIDDYAHHPEELRALIMGAKELFPGKKCTLVFQPHLYSRTRDLAAGFAEVLSLADEVLLLPIYPARELPIPGVSSNSIVENMKHPHVSVIEKDALPGWVLKNDVQLLIMSGAGDIDSLVEPVKKIVEAR